ncbi:MAG TPA: PLP-dependent aminotransferase family protein, partial [Acetobacteraceae bacterium]
RMRLRYRAGRDALVAALAEHAPGLAVAPPEQGLKLLAELPSGMDDVALAAAAARRGVVARPVSPMFLAAPPHRALLLGFSGHEPGALRWAARELGAALRA